MLRFSMITLSIAAAGACGDVVQAPEPFMVTDPSTGQVLCGITLDIGGFTSNDFQGSAINDTLEVFFGTGFPIVAVEWDLNLTSVGSSWADEATIGIEGQVFLIPGAGDSFTVTNANYSSGGPVYLADLGVPDVIVSPDGIVDIEFFETGFDDNPNGPDAIYEQGSMLTIYTSGWPTPGAVSTLAIAGLMCSKRRRNSAE